MPGNRFSFEEKVRLISLFKSSDVPLATFARNNGVSKSGFKNWLMHVRQEGLDGLKARKTRSKYSYQFKLNVVHDYLEGKGTLEELVYNYGLRNIFQVHDWIIKYNNGKLIKTKSSGKKVPIMSRKTTFEERIEIVEYVVKEHHSYNEAAEKFSVSYQQVRSWVLKSNENGYEALLDRRGKRKAAEDMTDLDKANLEIRRLKSQLRDQKIIEEFAKKLEELRHRG